MRPVVIALGAVALLGGCNRDSDKQAAEALIRASLVGQGNVQQLDLSRQADDNYSGTATVRRADGQVVRLNCTARRTGGEASVQFSTNCGQVLDQALLDEIKATLRRSIEGTGATVLQVDMSRQDENTATGSARARNPDGRIVQMTCEAARQADGTFNSRCQPVSGTVEPAPAPAPALGEDEPAPGGEEPAPADDQQ